MFVTLTLQCVQKVFLSVIEIVSTYTHVDKLSYVLLTYLMFWKYMFAILNLVLEHIFGIVVYSVVLYMPISFNSMKLIIA